MTPTKQRPRPDIGKATLYAIVVNAIQLVAVLSFVLYVVLVDISKDNLFYLQLIAIVGAFMAGWGALIDIQEALLTRRRERIINELQTTNEQMDRLNLKLREQRHDFLNHIQVVYSLMEMEEYSEATSYLERVYERLHTVSKVLRTRMTAFNALLQVKSAACEERGIALTLEFHSALEGLSVPPWELCCVVGNLLDNAMDAAIAAAAPRICLTAAEELRGFTITVRNNGALVPLEMRERIFEAGVSSKGEGHGMGLHIVRQTLGEYGASISLQSGDEETAFSVFIPRESPHA
ncbi:MAG: Spo0B domain-containing protein [Clostridia bacterium]